MCFNFANWLCSKEWTEVFQIWPRLTCFINIVLSSVVLVSTFAVLILDQFFLTMYNDVWITFLIVYVLLSYTLIIWNVYVLCYEKKCCCCYCHAVKTTEQWKQLWQEWDSNPRLENQTTTLDRSAILPIAANFCNHLQIVFILCSHSVFQASIVKETSLQTAWWKR